MDIKAILPFLSVSTGATIGGKRGASEQSAISAPVSLTFLIVFEGDIEVIDAKEAENEFQSWGAKDTVSSLVLPWRGFSLPLALIAGQGELLAGVPLQEGPAAQLANHVSAACLHSLSVPIHTFLNGSQCVVQCAHAVC